MEGKLGRAILPLNLQSAKRFRTHPSTKGIRPMESEKICDNCRHWSKLVVKIHKMKIEAACLNRDGPFYSLFCRGDQCCPAWESGHWGVIDDPSVRGGAYANHDN
jgi:hypothetical protein